MEETLTCLYYIFYALMFHRDEKKRKMWHVAKLQQQVKSKTSDSL